MLGNHVSQECTKCKKGAADTTNINQEVCQRVDILRINFRLRTKLYRDLERSPIFILCWTWRIVWFVWVFNLGKSILLFLANKLANTTEIYVIKNNARLHINGSAHHLRKRIWVYKILVDLVRYHTCVIYGIKATLYQREMKCKLLQIFIWVWVTLSVRIFITNLEADLDGVILCFIYDSLNFILAVIG